MMIVRAFRQAWRRLCKRPGYALLSIAVLGVGLGVALFMFTLVNMVVLQPYPFPHADRLVAIGEPQNNGAGIGSMDSDQYLTLRHKLKSVAVMGAWNWTLANVGNASGAGAKSYLAGRMTASTGAVLGVRPLLGRGFDAGDDAPGAPRVVLLSESLWRNVFHANPHIVGQSIKVNGAFATVIGVLPTSFQFPPAARVWLPMHLTAGRHQSVSVVARMAPGVALGQARAELDTFAGPLQRVLPPHENAKALTVAPLSYGLTPPGLRHWVWLMFGAGILVLLLACVNVANLQLVQTLKRRHELALRSALGSGRLRLLTGTLAESLILGFASLAPAFAITWGGLRWMHAAWVSIHPLSIPYVHGIDGWVIAFAVVVAILATAIAGGIPAWRASRANLGDALRDGSKSSSGRFARVTRTLVVAEVALTVVLLIGAGTFVRALDRLLTEPSAGATDAAIMTARVMLPGANYQGAAQRAEFLDAVVQHLRNTPGAVDATASNSIPSATSGAEIHVGRAGHPQPARGWPVAALAIAGPHFLNTYGIKLLHGRFFAARDRAGSKPVAVVDARMAARLWPHGDAIGHRLTLYPGSSSAHTVTIIGVIQTLQVSGGLSTPMPSLLVPLDQATVTSALTSVRIAVRAHADAAAWGKRLTAAVHVVDPRVATRDVYTQASAISRSRAGLTVLADAFGFLGGVALLLAAAGLYGVLAFSVAQRTREIGIRRAIGAGNTAIARTVGRALTWQLGLGLAIGVALALPWSGMLANESLRTRAHDPSVFVPVVLVVIGISLLAVLVPLVRALRVDPAEALRYE